VAAPVLEGWRDGLQKFRPRSRCGRLPPIRTAALGVSAPRKLRPGARPRSLGRAELTDQERRALVMDELRLRWEFWRRPRRWSDCEEGTGACPWVSCTMNLYLDVDPDSGIIKLNFPDREPHELAETCALRVIRDRGALSLDEVGKLVNLTQERVSQIEDSGKRLFKRGMGRDDES
jgi:hypothetical protein